MTIGFAGLDGATATLTLDRRPGAAPPLGIVTRRAGVPGSVIALRVDRSAEPLLVVTVPAEACTFSTGESLCRLDLSPPEPTFRAIVTAFERGRAARLEIRTGGVMTMDGSASLIGFRRAWR